MSLLLGGEQIETTSLSIAYMKAKPEVSSVVFISG